VRWVGKGRKGGREQGRKEGRTGGREAGWRDNNQERPTQACHACALQGEHSKHQRRKAPLHTTPARLLSPSSRPHARRSNTLSRPSDPRARESSTQTPQTYRAGTSTPEHHIPHTFWTAPTYTHTYIPACDGSGGAAAGWRPYCQEWRRGRPHRLLGRPLCPSLCVDGVGVERVRVRGLSVLSCPMGSRRGPCRVDGARAGNDESVGAQSRVRPSTRPAPTNTGRASSGASCSCYSVVLLLGKWGGHSEEAADRHRQG
jgi:hypothetical protein